jgi:hypothetical protein
MALESISWAASGYVPCAAVRELAEWLDGLVLVESSLSGSADDDDS